MARLAVALVVLACATAFGADDATTRAKAHFKQGAAYYAASLFAEALNEYEAAYALMPLPDIRFNIGQAHRMLGQKSAALEDYRKYLVAQPDGVAADEARRYVAELTVALDRERAQQAAAEKAAADKAAAEEKAAADKAAVDKAAPDKAAAGRAAADSATKPGSSKRVAGIVIGAVGIGALAGGAALMGLAKIANDDFLHPRDGVYSPEAESNRRSFAIGGITLLAIGGAAVVTGITLFALGRREAKPPSLAFSTNR